MNETKESAFYLNRRSKLCDYTYIRPIDHDFFFIVCRNDVFNSGIENPYTQILYDNSIHEIGIHPTVEDCDDDFVITDVQVAAQSDAHRNASIPLEFHQQPKC